METNLLRTFVTVAQHRHLTKAAQILHLTQPAVSGHIKALEERLNVRLFERSASGVTLTPAGQALLPNAEAILATVTTLHNTAKDLQGHLTGKAALGTILDPHFIRLGEFVNALRERHPSLDLELRQGISPWVMDGVSEGALDAAFFLGDKVHPNVKARPLVKLTYCVVAPPGWRTRIENADWPELADLPWVRGFANSPHLHMISEVLAKYQLTPRKAVEADQESTIKNLISAGVGLGLMREDLAYQAQRGGEVYVWERARLETWLSFVYLREREGDPVISAMDAILGGVWASTPIQGSP
ncbi:MAG: LysR family transcriptional regulator [Burkholderiales bacterium]